MVCESSTQVERRDKESKKMLNIIAIRLYMQGCPRLNRARKLLTERSKWYVNRIMNITPQLREFQALSSIREIPLLPVILNPVNQPCCRYESRTGNFSKLSQPMRQIIKSSYNGSQLQAITVAIGPFDKDFELTLIQGPPGANFLLSPFFSIFFLLFVYVSTSSCIDACFGNPLFHQELERPVQLWPSLVACLLSLRLKMQKG